MNFVMFPLALVLRTTDMVRRGGSAGRGVSFGREGVEEGHGSFEGALVGDCEFVGQEAGEVAIAGMDDLAQAVPAVTC